MAEARYLFGSATLVPSLLSCASTLSPMEMVSLRAGAAMGSVLGAVLVMAGSGDCRGWRSACHHSALVAGRRPAARVSSHGGEEVVWTAASAVGGVGDVGVAGVDL